MTHNREIEREKKRIWTTKQTFLISSKSCISGERPPCTHKNCWFINAANGKQSNASIHAMYTRSEYFIRPVKQKKGKRGEQKKKTNNNIKFDINLAC